MQSKSNESLKKTNSPPRRDPQLTTKLSHPKIVVGGSPAKNTGIRAPSKLARAGSGGSLYTFKQPGSGHASGATLNKSKMKKMVVTGASFSSKRNFGTLTLANVSNGTKKMPSSMEADAGLAMRVSKLQLSERNLHGSVKKSPNRDKELHKNASPLETLQSASAQTNEKELMPATAQERTKDLLTTEHGTTELISPEKSALGSANSHKKGRKRVGRYETHVNVDSSPHGHSSFKKNAIATVNSDESLKNSFRELLNASPRLRQSLDLANKMDTQMRKNMLQT